MVLKIEVHESAIKGANRSNIPKTSKVGVNHAYPLSSFGLL